MAVRQDHKGVRHPWLAREQGRVGEASLQGTSTYSSTQGRNVGCECHIAWLDSSWTKLGGRRKEQKGHWTPSQTCTCLNRELASIVKATESPEGIAQRWLEQRPRFRSLL